MLDAERTISHHFFQIVSRLLKSVLRSVSGLARLFLLLLIKENLVFDKGLLVDLLIVLDLFLNLIEKVGVDHSFIARSICFLFETVYLGDFLVIFVEDLLDIIFHLLYLLLKIVRLVLLLISLDSLHLAHLPLQQGYHLLQSFLSGNKNTFLLDY